MTNGTLDAARAEAYFLIADCLSGRLDEATIERLSAVPALAKALAELGTTNPVDLDELLADHHGLLQMQLPLYAGVFLHPEGRVGGHETAELMNFARESGLPTPSPGDDPEHLSYAFKLMGTLCQRSQGLEPGGMNAEILRRFQTRALDQFVLTWLPAVRVAIAAQGHPLFSALIKLTWELVTSHRHALAPDVFTTAPRRHVDLHAVSDLLNKPETGLKEIASHLISPARSGWFLSHGDLYLIAKAVDVPVAPASRKDVLLTLIYGAVDRSVTGPLLYELEALATRWCDALSRLADEAPPTCATAVTPWRSKIEQTQRLLRQVQRATYSAHPPQQEHRMSRDLG